MNVIHTILISLRGMLLTAGLFLLAGACFGQDAVPSIGEYFPVGDMARPEWRMENGQSVARFTVKSADAAAWRLTFQALNLPAGAQMFLRGTDASGATLALHGPFEGHGPLNVPDFSTGLITGNALTIEIYGAQERESWPFTLDSVEQVNAARLAELTQAGMEVTARFRPTIRKSNPNPDFRTAYVGDRLVKYEVVDGMAVFEGDVVLGTAEEVASGASAKSAGRKDAHITTYEPWIAYWPAGVIPYRIMYSGGSAITAGSMLDNSIKAAIAHWNGFFPGMLKARTNEVAFVTFEFKADLCQSVSVGRTGSEQKVQVGNNCSTGNLIHEIGHVLGMHHEHTRPDRDTFVTINWGNIQSGKGSQFEIPSAGESAGLLSYDFGSIMHYPLNAFSSNGSNTISVVGSAALGVPVIGQRNGLSLKDQTAMRALYCGPTTAHGPDKIEVDKDGAASGQFIFTSPAYCGHLIQTQASWIKVTSATSGFGSAVVSFTVDPNPGKYARSAGISYNGRSTIIWQEGSWVPGKQL